MSEADTTVSSPSQGAILQGLGSRAVSPTHIPYPQGLHMRRHLLDSDLQQLGVWQLTILESRISARPLTAKHRPLRQADTDLIYERDTSDPPAFGIPLMKGD